MGTEQERSLQRLQIPGVLFRSHISLVHQGGEKNQLVTFKGLIHSNVSKPSEDSYSNPYQGCSHFLHNSCMECPKTGSGSTCFPGFIACFHCLIQLLNDDSTTLMFQGKSDSRLLSLPAYLREDDCSRWSGPVTNSYPAQNF